MVTKKTHPIYKHKGRGAVSNNSGRYETLQRSPFDDGWETTDPPSRQWTTTVTNDTPRSIITRNNSPDVPFNQSVNPYQGCEHGCSYCYARPTHAYHGLSAGLDFETHLFAKPDAPRLLGDALNKPGYRCEVIALGANTDPYQPIERERQITRALLQVLSAHHHPVAIVTKSALIERDLDILGAMAERNLVQVFISMTTLQRPLARGLEPRAAAPHRRLETIRRLSTAGVSTGVLTAPIIPGLTDHEIEDLIEASAEAGAVCADYVLLRLPREVEDVFQQWLTEYEPLKAKRALSLLRQMRGGQMNDARFGQRMRGDGAYASMLARRFEIATKRTGLTGPAPALDTSQFRRPGTRADQLSLF